MLTIALTPLVVRARGRREPVDSDTALIADLFDDYRLLASLGMNHPNVLDKPDGIKMARAHVKFARQMLDARLVAALTDDLAIALGDSDGERTITRVVAAEAQFVSLDTPVSADDPLFARDRHAAGFDPSGGRDLLGFSVITSPAGAVHTFGYYKTEGRQADGVRMTDAFTAGVLRYLDSAPRFQRVPRESAVPSDSASSRPSSAGLAAPDERDQIVLVRPYSYSRNSTEWAQQAGRKSARSSDGAKKSPGGHMRSSHYVDKSLRPKDLARLDIFDPTPMRGYFVRLGRKGGRVRSVANRTAEEAVSLEKTAETQELTIDPRDRQVFAAGSHKADAGLFGIGDVFYRDYNSLGQVIGEAKVCDHPDYARSDNVQTFVDTTGLANSLTF